MKKILAFTLAETLIVMGVIGIVSALTLPNLNSSTGEKEKIAKVKKIYQNLTDAVSRAQAVYGPIDEWKTLDADSSAQVTRFGERITEFMKVSKNCGTQQYKGCFSNKDVKYIAGTVAGRSIDHNLNYKIILADGTAISMTPTTFNADIDGPNKGQNQLGTDIFIFKCDEKGNILPYGPDSNNFSEYFEGGRNSIMLNGNEASSWIINYDNMDYLKLNDSGKCPNGTTPTEQNPRCK